ncbi:MAG: KEOPS complex kinase/ATPase Bud32, partial [Candidatus Aenigmarchaeota archaeon]|nr:KEOPS complex kinase/ATPase Bud32 [Candidatus Aenigmarchaeota archaeon]MDI6722638.1 KEOPS complex kinase/ATPase Bud32 [Candidatus Aenigmarchaeota archaeon]
GAEAEIRKSGNEIEKMRIKKGYRIQELDERLRKRRAQLEARLISEARRAGVKTPVVFSSDRFTIRMEYIEGRKVKDVLNEKNAGRLCAGIAEPAASLHNKGIIHGDLTTSNMILKNGEIYFIDFGLGCRSVRAEDKASDLYLLHEAFRSAHFDVSEKGWKTVLKVYREKSNDWNNISKALKKIEKRRRYSKGD